MRRLLAVIRSKFRKLKYLVQKLKRDIDFFLFAFFNYHNFNSTYAREYTKHT